MHYINYGTAKTGTTWLWKQLSPLLCDTIDKEPPIKLNNDLNDYKTYFKSCKISANLNPNLWQIDSNKLAELKTLATHTTIIFRNPFDYANSLYNFWKLDKNSETFVDSFRVYFDYCKISKRVDVEKILLFDELIENPQSFLNSITDYIGVDRMVANPAPVNVTAYKKNLCFSEKQIKMLNENIDKFQDYLKKDLQHWKSNV